METLQWHEIIQAAVKQVGKRAVYLANHLEYNTEEDQLIWDTACRLVNDWQDKYDVKYDAMVLITIDGLAFFDTEEQWQDFYNIFEHPLLDSSPIYASSYLADGTPQSENT